MTELPKYSSWFNQSIETKSGATICPECDTKFEIDDKLECIFGDTHNLRLPATFELREVLTPYGKASNLDSGNTFLWNQPIDRLRIYRPPASLTGQFLHEN